jgi:S1-C subfamily serine protease
MIIQENLGKPLAVVVEREGKTQTLDIKLPKEIPAQHLY